MNVLALKWRLQFDFYLLTAGEEGVAQFLNQFYLRALLRNIVSKFNSPCSYIHRPIDVHTNRNTNNLMNKNKNSSRQMGNKMAARTSKV